MRLYSIYTYTHYMYNILVNHDIKSITGRDIVRKLESGKR